MLAVIFCFEFQGSNEHELDRLKFHLMLATEDHLILKEEHFNTLSGIWKNVIERTFLHYKQAATAYFTYLKISGNEVSIIGNFSGFLTHVYFLFLYLLKTSGKIWYYDLFKEYEKGRFVKSGLIISVLIKVIFKRKNYCAKNQCK